MQQQNLLVSNDSWKTHFLPPLKPSFNSSAKALMTHQRQGNEYLKHFIAHTTLQLLQKHNNKEVLSIAKKA